MRHDIVGLPFRFGTTKWLSAKTTQWIPLNGVYKAFTAQATKGSTVALTVFSVKLYGALSTGSTSATLLLSLTSANRVKSSTGNLPFTYVKFSCTAFTTAAGRLLRVEACALP